MNNTQLLSQLLEQEEQLKFSHFDSLLAYKIGLYVVEKSFKENLPIAVDITIGSRCLFHFSSNGATLDNKKWIERKSNSVRRFNHSSYYLGRHLDSEGVTMQERYMIDEKDYAFHGGSFPIIVKHTGTIGTMTVSGLKQEEDHALVVEALREFLQ
jgi:uncharacterized protein (UPF0303 family)